MGRSQSSGGAGAPDGGAPMGGVGRLVPGLAAAAALLAYAPTLPYGLVWDDPVLIAQTRGTVEARGLVGLVLSPFLRDPVSGASLGYYRPVLSLAIWLTSRLAEIFPWAYHTVLVALHAVNCALGGHLLLRLVRSPGAALFGSLLFAVHPVHTESVAFFSGLTDVLATTFVLCAGLVLQRAAPVPAPGRRRHAALYAVTLLLGCLCKEMVLLFPAVLAIWHGAGRSAGGWRLTEAWRRHRLLIIASVAAPLLALGLRSLAGGIPLLPAAAPARAVPWASLPALWATYARLLVMPWPLNALYSQEQLVFTPAAALCSLLLLGAAGACAGERHRRVGVRALAWIVVFLAPVSGLLALTSAPIADRFLYLPSVGYCLLCGYLAELVAGYPRLRRPAALLAAAVLLLGGGGAAWRSRIWKDEVSLFADVGRTTPNSPLAHNNYGDALMDAGRVREAYAAFLTAVRLQPSFARALYNAGVAAAALDDPEEAASYLRQAAALKPDWAAPLIELGETRARARLWAEAEQLFRQAVRAEPGNALAHKDLGLARLMQGDRAGAREQWRLLSQLDPVLARDLESWIERTP